MKKLKIAVLISGRGSNLQALIKACAQPDYPAQISVVISNNPEAAGLAYAVEAGIPAMICDHHYFQDDKAAFEQALATIIKEHNADLVCLAGFMRLLSPVFLNLFKDRVINIHPSLLPAHKGLNTHEKVLSAGDKIHGCSVHVVTPEMDRGAIIAQKTINVESTDTPESLSARLLPHEHALYPEVIADIASGRVIIRQGRIERPSIIRHYNDTPIESERDIDMNQHHTPHEPLSYDQENIIRAQDMWNNFTKATIISGGAVIAVLVLLALIFI